MLPNILNMAMQLTGAQSFTYYPYIDRAKNDIGNYVARFGTPVQICGQIQAVPRSIYTLYGLDFQKDYITVYISQDAFDVARDITGDQFVFANNKYQCLSNVPWYDMNGWVSILAVRIPNV